MIFGSKPVKSLIKTPKQLKSPLEMFFAVDSTTFLNSLSVNVFFAILLLMRVSFLLSK